MGAQTTFAPALCKGALHGSQVTNWSGTCYIFPLLGAFIADSYLGRYKTIIIFSMVYIIVSHPLSLEHGTALPGHDSSDC